jgi:hypothetical protein
MGAFMNKNKFRKILTFASVGALLALTFVNCSGFNSSTLSSSANRNGTASTEVPSPNSSFLVGISSLPPVNSNLGEESVSMISLTSTSAAPELVNLSVDRSQIETLPCAADVEVVLNPSQVSVPANGSVAVSVKVTVYASAPSFSAKALKIVASKAGDPSLKISRDMAMTVMPIYEYRMFGGADPAKRWDRPATVEFCKHSSPLEVKYINYDTTVGHVLHGSGSVPHGNTALPLAAASAVGQPGGVYSVMVSTTATATGTFYYHDLGGDSTNSKTFMPNKLNPVRSILRAVPLAVAIAAKNISPSRFPANALPACDDIGSK